MAGTCEDGLADGRNFADAASPWEQVGSGAPSLPENYKIPPPPPPPEAKKDEKK